MHRLLVSAATLLVAALALAALASLDPGTLTAAPSATVHMTATEFAFDPGALSAAPGEPMTITLEDIGRAPHNIVFELDGGRKEETPIIRAGEVTTLTFTSPLAPGKYVFYCAVGNHREEGMEGVFTVGGPGGFEVVADGLLNPRGLALQGAELLVSEGGTGTPGTGFVEGDDNGRVTLLSLDDPSNRSVIVDGLGNAVDPGGGVVGANHAVWRSAPVASGTYLVALSGGGGHPDPKAQILSGDPGSPFDVLVDMWGYEEANNPDGTNVDSNPWRIAQGVDGALYLSDAGANDVLKYDPASGATSTYAVFEAVGMRDDGSAISPVATGLAFDPAHPGVLYASLLGSVALNEGQVRRLEDLNGDGDALDDGENTLVLDNLTMAVDLAFAPDGRLFVLEYGGPTAKGRLREVKDALDAVVVDGLKAPSALVFTSAGDALVAAGDPGDTTSPAAHTDRVLRIPADMLVGSAPTPTPTTEPQPTEPPATSGVVYLPYAYQADRAH